MIRPEQPDHERGNRIHQNEQQQTDQAETGVERQPERERGGQPAEVERREGFDPALEGGLTRRGIEKGRRKQSERAGNNDETMNALGNPSTFVRLSTITTSVPPASANSTSTTAQTQTLRPY